MRKSKIIKSFVLIGILTSLVNLQGQTLSDKLYEDIKDNQLDEISRIEAAFIISGAEDGQRLKQGIKWFQNLLADVQTKNIIEFEKIPSAERVFLYLHTTWLKDYKEKSTTLFDILERREFNCVSATVLYNLTCEELGLATYAFETPTHVYTIFPNFTERVMVENTTSMGFNIMKNLKSYSQYLKRYYPDQKSLKIGLDRLYYYENSKGREINNTELLGLIGYNLAIFNAQSRKYDKAYQYVELAQLFNGDSRSNREFEISLYYRWGKQLFDAKRFYDAFEVIADGFFRYPENADFKKNCRSAYIRALDELWKEKNWARTEMLIYEMDDLEIRAERETQAQQNILRNWINYFRLHKKQEDAKLALKLLNDYS